MDEQERFDMLLDELPDYVRSFFVSKNDKYQIKTKIAYALDIKTFLKWFLDACADKTDAKSIKEITYTDLEKLSYDDIDLYLAYLTKYKTLNKKHEIITVENNAHGKARKLATIRVLFKYLLKRQYITFNPVELAESPEMHENKGIVTLSAEQQEVFLSKAYHGEGRPIIKDGQSERGVKKTIAMRQKTKYRDYAILCTLLSSGIRVSELCNIDMFDINFDEQYFVITRKGGSKSPQVYFGKLALEAIRDYIENERYVLAGYSKNGPEYLKFIDSDGPLFITGHKDSGLKRITPRRVQQIVKEYSAFVNAKNEKITPHTLRKTFGTELFNEYKDILLVKNALGHSDSATTTKYYVGYNNNALKVIKDR